MSRAFLDGNGPAERIFSLHGALQDEFFEVGPAPRLSRSAFFPGSAAFGNFGEKVQTVPEFSFRGKEGVVATPVDSVAIVMFAAGRDGFPFTNHPSHPTKARGGEHLRVEPRHFRTDPV